MTLHRATFSMTMIELQIICQNVVYFSNPEGTLTHTQIASDLETNWVQWHKQFQTNVARWDSIRLKKVGSNEAESLHVITPVLGVTGNNMMHPSVGLKILTRTGIAGRKGRGRYYIAGTRSDFMNRVSASTAAVTAFNVLKGQVLGRYGPSGSSTLRLVLFHRGGEGENFTQVSDLALGLITGIQRRRNQGVGI